MSAEKSARKPVLVDLDQDEQLNIINQTGILHKLKEAEKGEEQEVLMIGDWKEGFRASH